MLCSLLENSREPDNIIIHVADAGIEHENLEKLKYLVSRYNAKLNLLKIDKQKYSDL